MLNKLNTKMFFSSFIYINKKVRFNFIRNFFNFYNDIFLINKEKKISFYFNIF